jgi:PAS domain S-box-containing protein
MSAGAPQPPSPGRAGRVRRFLAAAPELLTAIVAALLFAGVLQWRYLADRAEFQRAASAIDNVTRARLHLTRAYLIARSIEARDQSFTPADADAELDRAQLAIDDWVNGRTAPVWSHDAPVADPTISRLATAYRVDVRGFRAMLREPESRAKPVALRRAYSLLEARGDSIGTRAGFILRERERRDRMQHEATLFALVFSIVLAGGWLRRAAAAAREAGERERRLHRLTAALAVAHTPADVAEAVAEHAIGVGGATLGSIGLVTADRREVEIIGRRGAVPEEWHRFPIDTAAPAAHVIATRSPLFIENQPELHARFPILAGAGSNHVCALAVVPLAVAPRPGSGAHPGVLGYISFTFTENRRFSPGERRFMETIGDLAAQAMDRARTYIAEREARADASRERERLAVVLDRLPVGVIVVDAAGRVTLHNRAAAALLGRPLPAGTPLAAYEQYRLADATGRPYRAEEYPIARALRGEVIEGEVMRQPASAGREATFSVSAAPGPSGPDGPAFAVAGLLDVTPLEEAQRALRESEARLRQMAERLPVGIFVTDASGRVTWGNPRLAEIFGTSLEAVLRDGIIAYVADEDRARMEAERRRFRAAGPESARFEFRVRQSATGKLRQVVMESSAQRGPAGEAEGTVGVVEDVTEQRALEAQLAQSQKMEAVGRLAGGVAHDFNNLLTAMLASTDLLLEDTPRDDPRVADLGEIRDAVLRASELTGQLLAFSRRQVIQPRPFDVNALARGAEKLLRRVIGEDVELALVLAPDLPQAYGDPGQVQQALMNLVVNARDAMPEGGALRISTHLVPASGVLGAREGEALAGAYVELVVSDTGTGMDADTRERVFEPFFTTKEVGKGTGLGLSMVYGALAQMGGRVAVESEPGRGSAFHLYLPLAGTVRESEPEPAWRVKTPPRPHAARAQHAVLLVEDDAALRRAMQRMLDRAGFEVLPAEGAEEALAIARGHAGPIDLVLTDVVMKGAGGRETAEAIAKVRPEAKIAFMSGYTADVVLRQRVSDGEAFIQKPFTPDELVAFVRGVIGG